jgi:hypothetical protein
MAQATRLVGLFGLGPEEPISWQRLSFSIRAKVTLSVLRWQRQQRQRQRRQQQQQQQQSYCFV